MKSDWSNKKILVTGATGFLAGHLIPSLLQKGAEIVGISLERNPDISSKNFSHYSVDLKNKEELNSVIKKINPNKIFHLAAYPDQESTFENTDKCIQNNIQGTLNLIHSLNGMSYDSFIHIGSYKEYSANDIPFKETDALFPVSSYAISKACTEMFCMAYHKIHNLPMTSIRFSTVYGPNQPDKNLIPHLIESGIQGKTLKLTKGEQKRELLYVSDVIAVLEKASLNSKTYGEIINVGTGEEYSLKEIIKLVLQLTGSKIEPEWGAIPYRENEIWRMKGDNTKVQKILNWKPKVSLKEGLIKTIEYYKNASG
jgi:nucleoside-diphosphate-sugar epimerase